MIRANIKTMGLTCCIVLGSFGPVDAYSYASPTSNPLIANRAAFLKAVSQSDWGIVATSYGTMKSEIVLLEKGDGTFEGDAGLEAAFSTAISNKDSDAIKAALHRANVDDILRRLDGAEKNLKTFQTAKALVVAAQAFVTAMAGDLPPSTLKTVNAEMQKALDAVGQPGVFGYGAVPMDATAFATAHKAIVSALRPTPAGDPPSK